MLLCPITEVLCGRRLQARKMQESGWKPRWFQRDSEDGTYRYVGGYWEAREQRPWVGCNDIFGNLSSSPKLPPSGSQY
jgi:oxysterol-binding protein 1